MSNHFVHALMVVFCCFFGSRRCFNGKTHNTHNYASMTSSTITLAPLAMCQCFHCRCCCRYHCRHCYHRCHSHSSGCCHCHHCCHQCLPVGCTLYLLNSARLHKVFQNFVVPWKIDIYKNLILSSDASQRGALNGVRVAYVNFYNK